MRRGGREWFRGTTRAQRSREPAAPTRVHSWSAEVRMIASYPMNFRRLRRRRSWAQLAAVGSLLVGAPPAAQAVPEAVAVRGIPSSLSANYGPAVPIGGSAIAAPTGGG